MPIIKDLQILLRAICVYIFICLSHRVVFWFLFSPQKPHDISSTEVITSWWLGFRFDLRLICSFLLGFSVLFFLLRWGFKRVKHPERFLRPLQIGLMALGFWLYLLVLWADFGNYSYLYERISIKMLELILNPSIAMEMIAQSYPLFLILPGFILCILAILWIISSFIFSQTQEVLIFPPHKRYYKKDILVGFIAFLFLAFGVHSRFSQYPLRWSEVYFSKYNFINQFSLNPLHNIIDTWKFLKTTTYNQEDIAQEIDLVKKDIGIPHEPGFLLTRPIKTQPLFQTKPNIVIIMMESLAAFKIGSYGIPLNTTPHLDQIISESLLFDNFHVPIRSTAGSIFCFFTSIPDFNEADTASRNPLIIDQHVPVNNFKNYKKFYFIGGDANWGNIRGMLKNNIRSLELIEGKSFSNRRADVWGVTDIDLFKEAHRTIKSLKKEERFFVFIQTAGYHRPYTVPKKGTHGFKKESLTEENRKKYAFTSEKSYNSLRFSDHALGYFFKLAKKSPYYKNTLFVIYADHGLSITDASQLSSFYIRHGFPHHHIPLVFHSALLPEKLKGTTNSVLGYEPDILPTLQSMAGLEGMNSGFGVDLLSPKASQRKGILLAGSGAFPIKFFNGERIIYTAPDDKSQIKSYRTQNFLRQLHAIEMENHFLNEEEKINDEIKELTALGRAYFKTIRFKLKNNRKKQVYSSFNNSK